MTAELSIDDFSAFFQAINGCQPFKWQVRLAEQVADRGEWPDLLDLPTGCGKTATIDIAIFLLALQPRQPRRILFVVDRRVIVHQASRRAQGIKKALTNPTDPVVEAVRARLVERAYARCLPVPLAVAELRGGIVRDETWAMRPDTPAVLVSTVDQVGSRLLFRGYGLSRGMRPIHAGLLGNDALFLLDEVHLARPFAATLADIGTHYRTMGGLPSRWQVVELSATPAKVADDRFPLADEDREDAAIQRRCGAVKPVELRIVKVNGTDVDGHRPRQVDAVVEAAMELAERPGGRRVGIVVNRVATAVAVHRKLGPSALLLTGRMRPFDREDAQKELEQGSWLLGRRREEALQYAPQFVVATQSIEAGADLDLDGLITECAPYDALVQRFGRLDRDGVLSEAGTPGQGIVVATSAQVAGVVDDPVYGPALKATWDWLATREPLDFGIDGRQRPSVEDEPLLRVAPLSPPVLMPTHLDAWVQTAPRPAADPDPDLWLHGLRDNPDLDVSVIWRADLGENLGDWDKDDLVDWVAACPPTSGEAMPVPISALRRWLSGATSAAADVADVDGPPAPHPAERRDDATTTVLRWRIGDESGLVPPRAVRPGDTIIVPSARGGVGAGRSWAPDSDTPVLDLGARSAQRRNRLVLRLAPGHYPGAPTPDPALDEDEEQDAADRAAVCAWLLSDGVREWLEAGPAIARTEAEALETLREAASDGLPDLRIRRFQHAGGMALIVDKPWPNVAVDDEQPDTVDSEPGTSEYGGAKEPVTLEQHLVDVEDWARGMADACGLPEHVADDLALAGRLHDVGKADPRFQQVLMGGRAASPTLLAKSSGPAPPPGQRRQIQRRAGYPLRARHELLSTSLVQGSVSALATAHDPDLVLHLVASHHGHARPGVPVAEDRAPVEVTVPDELAGAPLEGSSDHRLHALDSGVAERFWMLNQRYGRYGLAWMESILRLADHRASAMRQEDR